MNKQTVLEILNSIWLYSIWLYIFTVSSFKTVFYEVRIKFTYTSSLAHHAIFETYKGHP